MTCAGYTIGLVNNVLDPGENPGWPIDRTMQLYFGGRVDLIVCGHTHIESIRRYDDVIVINPGSPTFPPNYLAQLATVAVLELDPSRGGTVTTYDLRTLAPLAGRSVSF